MWLLVWFVLTRLGVGWLLSSPAGEHQRRLGGLGNAEFSQLVTMWDGQWYARIASYGYPLPLPLDEFGAVEQSEWAFFPLFPLLVRVVMAFGLPFWVAALTVNLAASATAAWLAYRLFAARGGASASDRDRDDRHDRDRAGRHRKAAAVAVGLWLLYPASTVLQIAYTEALALVLVLAALTMIHRQRYGIAVVLVLVLGFARAVAAPLAFVVVVHLVIRWRRERREPTEGHPAGHARAWWFSGLALLGASVVAGAAWPVLVGWLTGRPDAFLAVQATWGQRPDRGPFLPWWGWLSWEYGTPVALAWAVGLVVVCASMLTRYAAWMPLELRAWGLVYPLYLFAVTAPSTSMIRFLLLDVPVFGVLTAVLIGDPRRGRLRRWWPVGPVLCLPVLAATVYWWTTVVLVFSPPMDWPP